MVILKTQTIADFVKAFREHSGFTQESLGKRIGHSAQHVSNVERGVDKKPIPFCVRLSKILNKKEADHLDTLLKDTILDIAVEKIEKKKEETG